MRILLATISLMVVMSCSKPDKEIELLGEELIINSGFEGSVMGVPEEAHRDIIGIDETFSTPNDWDGLDRHANIGDFTLQYEGGEVSERKAVIIDDPDDPNNRVLHFWLHEPNVSDDDGNKFKGRVQANIYNNQGIRELTHRVKMKYHSDFSILKEAPATIHWLTVFEYWNNAPWTGEDHRFRITVETQKLETHSGAPLHFGIHAQTFDEENNKTEIWAFENRDFDIPIDQWLTVEIYYKEGDTDNGRFVMTVTTEGGMQQTIFNITHATHHPDDPSPDGLGHLNPMKLYTSDDLINWVNDQDRTLQIYWDDFSLWLNRPPE